MPDHDGGWDDHQVQTGDARAVLIGSSTFDDSGLTAIPVVKRCLDDLRHVLTADGLVHPDHCAVLLDEAGLPELGRKLIAGLAGAEDLLIVYYVGHGLIGRRGELYLGMRATDVAYPEHGSLPWTTLHDRIADSPARTKIVILDCCFSGRALGETLSDPVSVVRGQLEIEGTCLLTSAQRNQVALVLPNEPHTSFTGRLLDILTNGIEGGGEFLTVDEVYRALVSRMTGAGLSTPEKLGTRTADRFRIARNAAARDTAESLEDLLEQTIALAMARGWANFRAESQDLADRHTDLLGAEHPNTLRARRIALVSRGASGDPTAAELLTELVAAHIRVLGPSHPDTLRARRSLAMAVGESGDRALAIEMLRVLLPHCRTVFGGEDDATCRTQHVLARYLAEAGARPEAVALLEEVVAIRERVWGHDYPTSRSARLDLRTLTTNG
ncbi:caspase family protein [Actinokineospora inagensis]|uniref:caspase family protein n=1 Tax=Actinokineospora inagensis TaxID=103730 RepID=UPI00047E0A6B|nr:tetratricopeptide repeat protein [Actinokineospora inagensis]